MADAQLPHEDVRAALLRSNAVFQQLVSEHHALDEEVHRLATQTYLNHQQQLEEAALKKRKLAWKDQIEAIVRKERASHSHSRP